jgi:bifunctional UDP-N-acetylglucosamine pyrophosphorylase/glucosamine-1-phosphate N-acetyltransferase
MAKHRNNMNNAYVILAAGLGTRMNSSLPKVLHPVYGIPMIRSIISTVKSLRPGKIVVIAGEHIDIIRKVLDDQEIVYVRQREQKGTGHALRSARRYLKRVKGSVVVLNGDTPLVTAQTIRKFLLKHRKDRNMVSVLSFQAQNPDSYGRIFRDKSGQIMAIMEERDASVEQKKIKEVNSGMYALHPDALSFLDEIKMNKKKKEYYLTDIIDISLRKRKKTAAYCIGQEKECIGVNTKQELHQASEVMKERIINHWIEKGVYFIDQGAVYIHPDAVIGSETTLYPNVSIGEQSRIGKRATIYPNVRIYSSIIGNDVTIKDSTVIEESVVKNGASVGPFAHLRPQSEVGSGARIGNFVELKKTVVGKKTNASHLSYLGDAIIGREVNIGAGTITCNYDGEKKHVTIIDDNVFIGSDTQLVAPIKIGRGAYIGAGSTITKDVPSWALALSRSDQKKILNWARKKLKVKRKKLK